jgi:hypothetical protein
MPVVHCDHNRLTRLIDDKFASVAIYLGLNVVTMDVGSGEVKHESLAIVVLDHAVAVIYIVIGLELGIHDAST